jgi:hypothetical protein
MSFLKPKSSEDSGSVLEKPHVNVYDADGPKFSKERTAQLLRKMDWNIVPFLALLYLYVLYTIVFFKKNLNICPSLSFLDRSNIGNARLAGLEKDLKMKGLDYNVS